MPARDMRMSCNTAMQAASPHGVSSSRPLWLACEQGKRKTEGGRNVQAYRIAASGAVFGAASCRFVPLYRHRYTCSARWVCTALQALPELGSALPELGSARLSNRCLAACPACASVCMPSCMPAGRAAWLAIALTGLPCRHEVAGSGAEVQGDAQLLRSANEQGAGVLHGKRGERQRLEPVSGRCRRRSLSRQQVGLVGSRVSVGVSAARVLNLRAVLRAEEGGGALQLGFRARALR